MLAKAFARRLANYSKVVVFASGVSNSLETSRAAFEREEKLLTNHLRDASQRFVYFSSCGVIDDESNLTAYMKHKALMESLVLSSTDSMVIRLPQVVGSTSNPHTLANFLRDRIVSGEKFNIWSGAERNLIDIDDIVDISVPLIVEPMDEDRVFSVAATKSLGMLEIVRIFESVLGKTANCSIENKGTPLVIDSRKAAIVAARLGIELDAGYVEKVVKKYYASASLLSSSRNSCA